MPEILNVYTRLFDQVDIKEAYGTFYDRLTQMTSSLQSTFDATFTITKIEEHV